MGILAEMTGWQMLLAVMMVFVCLLLIGIVLLQRGRGGGLAGAFGGGGGSSAFGAKTGDVLTWATVIVTFFFVGLNIFANFAFDQTPVRAAPSTFTAPGDAGDEAAAPNGGGPNNAIPINLGDDALPINIDAQGIVDPAAGEKPETAAPKPPAGDAGSDAPAGDPPAGDGDANKDGAENPKETEGAGGGNTP